jgi:hypothetical protein
MILARPVKIAHLVLKCRMVADLGAADIERRGSSRPTAVSPSYVLTEAPHRPIETPRSAGFVAARRARIDSRDLAEFERVRIERPKPLFQAKEKVK